MPSRAIAVCLFALASVVSVRAAAQVRPSPWALGGVIEAGGMLTDDQREQLHLGAGGGGVRLEGRARPFDGIDWIEGELRGGFLVVGPGPAGVPGGVLDVTLGFRLAPRIDSLRPYASVAFGVAFTGPLARPVGEAAIGLAVDASDEIAIGPEIDLQHVIQWDGPDQSSDAVFLAIAFAMTYRPVSRPPPPPAPAPEIPDEPAPTPPPVIEPAFDPAPPPEPTRIEELMFLVDDAVCGGRTEVVTLLPPVLFDHDRAELTAAGEVAMHDVLARVLEAPADAHVVVEGHADVTGTSDYNETLALARAHAIGEWLRAHGVPAEQLEEIGHGERAPLVDGDTTEALAPNRRVTIRIEQPMRGPS